MLTKKGPVSNAIVLVAHARVYVDIDITVFMSVIFDHLFRQTILMPVKESCRLVKGNGPVCNTVILMTHTRDCFDIAVSIRSILNYILAGSPCWKTMLRGYRCDR